MTDLILLSVWGVLMGLVVGKVETLEGFTTRVMIGLASFATDTSSSKIARLRLFDSSN